MKNDNKIFNNLLIHTFQEIWSEYYGEEVWMDPVILDRVGSNLQCLVERFTIRIFTIIVGKYQGISTHRNSMIFPIFVNSGQTEKLHCLTHFFVYKRHGKHF